MKIIYECEYCHKQFDNKAMCETHEMLHLHDIDRLKYYVIHVLNDRPCSYCANAYYAYGCERGCAYPYCNEKNNYRCFKKEDACDDL